MKTTLVCLTIAAIAGCQQQPSQLDHIGMVQMPGKALATESHAAVAPSADLPKDAEGRITRLERRLDKVISILEQAMPPNEPDPDGTYAVAIDPVDPIQGPADAKVTIVEGFEFLCPYCFMVNPTVDQILQKYPKDVRLVSKYLIIHGQPALAPGMAACAAAKQGKFKEMKAALWSHLFKLEAGRPQMQQDQVAPENMEKIAAEAGVDVAKLKADMSSCGSWLESSKAALNPVGASGTPAFFINGHYVNGAQPFEVFDKVVQQELAKADKAIADGTPQKDYYQRQVLAKGLTRVKGRFED